MTGFGWGVVGPGRIAHKFAEAVQGSGGMRLAAVCGRDVGRSRTFAERWAPDGGAATACASLDAMLATPGVDGIYVATPHAFHAETIRTCLAAGRPVLCEKPLVPDLASGREVVALARSRRTFLMEAVWTRFLPIYEVVARWLRDGAIGRVAAIQSAFCFHLPYDATNRAYDPAQAGGGLLDLGVYNLTMTRWALAAALGECPPLSDLHSRAAIGPGGVDHRLAATLELGGGIVSQLICGFEMSADNSLRIIGERGTIVVPSFWQATEAQLRVAGREPEVARRLFRVNGFEYEIEAAVAAIRGGAIESERITHDESLETLAWMDRIRAMVGVRYPFEAAPDLRPAKVPLGDSAR